MQPRSGDPLCLAKKAVGLTALIMIVNSAALLRLVDALLAAPGCSGRTLLIDGVNPKVNNIIIFALLFWNLAWRGRRIMGAKRSMIFSFRK